MWRCTDGVWCESPDGTHCPDKISSSILVTVLFLPPIWWFPNSISPAGAAKMPLMLSSSPHEHASRSGLSLLPCASLSLKLRLMDRQPRILSGSLRLWDFTEKFKKLLSPLKKTIHLKIWRWTKIANFLFCQVRMRKTSIFSISTAS